MAKKLNQIGVIHTLPLLVIVAAVGIISFLLISSAAPFKGGLFEILNPKPGSKAATATSITTPLKASTLNPNYFVDGNGKAVFLTGSHTWNNLQDWGVGGAYQNLDFSAYVNMMTSHNQNFTLLWRTELPHFCNLPTNATQNYDVTEQPYLRTGPGNAADGGLKFDLDKFDQSFFDRLRSRTQQLNSAGIYAGIYFFTGEWPMAFRCGNSSDGYPFSIANNINHIDDGGGVGSETMTSPNAITAYQDAYMNKVIDTLNDLPNVLWIVSEEAPGGSAWWNKHLISAARSYESSKPFQHPIGLAWYNGGSDSDLYNSDADWVAPTAGVSPTTSCGSGTPRCKVNVNDSDHSYFGMWNQSTQANRNFFWTNFTQGDSVMFMDPYTVYYPREGRNNCVSPVNGICSAPDPRWENVRSTMGYIRSYADRMNLIAMLPKGNLTSTGNMLANLFPIGSEYLVYSSNGGGFSVNLSNTTRSLSVEWFNPSTGVKTSAGTVNGGANNQSFTPPFSGDAVLYLVDAGGAGTPLPTPVPTQGPPVRIMPLGDSVTYGWVTWSPGAWSYRYYLWKSLQQAGYTNIDFVGSLTTVFATGDIWDQDNEGHAGDTAADVANNAVSWATSARPDIVLLHIGTNGNNGAVTADNDVSRIIDNLRSVNPSVKIILAKIIPQGTDFHTAYNNELVVIASKKTTGQSPITVIDQSAGFDPNTDLADGIHPNALGDQKIANKFFSALSSLLTSCTGCATPTPTPTPSPIPGDIDGDGMVGLFDYNILVTNYGKNGSGIQGDIDNNGIVDIFDYNVLVTNFGKHL